MQIQTFDAPTLEAAQRAVRRALGDDALVLATEATDGGFRITAAVEPELRVADLLQVDDQRTVDPALVRILAHHGVPGALTARLAASVETGADAESALARALRPHLRSSPPARHHLLSGPPGHGKTMALVRMAKAALAAGDTPRVFSLQSSTTIVDGRLQACLATLGVVAERVTHPGDLAAAVARDPGPPRLIDTPGVAIDRAADAQALREALAATDAMGLVVLSAESLPQSLLESAASFLGLGCRAVLVTKLDLTRRYGGLVALAASGVPLAPASVGGGIDDALTPLSAAGLARLLVHTARARTATPRPMP
ncbi:MAG: hypothetical protein AAFX81_10440 [Pseudomonadota bacterium]